MAFAQTPLAALRGAVDHTLWEVSGYGKFLLVKIVLGVTIATVSLALTLPFHFLAGIQQQAPALLQLNLLLAVVVIYIAARLRRGW